MATKSLPQAPPPPTYIFREHKSSVNSVHLFDNDQYLASSDGDGWVIIWSMRTKRPLLKWKAHKDNCLKVTTVKNNQLISQGRDNMIHIWQLPSLQDASLNEVPELISSIVYNGLGFCKFSYDDSEESMLLCFPSIEEIALFDIYDLTYQRYLARNIGQIDSGSVRLGSCMAVELFRTSDTLFVLAGYESGTVALWEINKTSKLVWHQQVHTEPGIVAVKIRPDNKIFASGGYDGRIRIFSVKSMKPLAILSYHRNTTYGLDFSRNGNWLIGSSQDNRISLWSIF
ncbi:hypothetical protein INT48_008205 [Thamnidium elegans]|uniref:ASTRA-associated protein 1 n=1 Tax=Thamnidium elegans TaxID=101142 RepID=A0A8H7SX56_9FUNG|nr:hypothetical protein INT48_008205 [Thamnidium elegans]